MKTIFPLITAMLGMVPGVALAQNDNVVDEVIWVVGDQPILRSDVEEARIAAELYGERVDNPYEVIPEQLAIEKLYLHQAELDSVEVDEASVIRMADMQIERAVQNFGSRENVAACVKKIFMRLMTEHYGAADDFDVGASMGVAVAPDDGGSFEELYEKADEALYRVKRGGKNGYAFFKN